jgi:hypothetical protein
MSAPFVTTDKHGRVSLGARHGDGTIIVEETVGGSVLLTPAKTVSAVDDYIVHDPKILAALAEEPTSDNTVPRRCRPRNGEGD